MKKITILMVAIAFLILNVNAQEELVSKKGFKILPESGDYAIGVDFAPFIKTVNLNASNTAPSMDFSDGFSIFVKRFVANDQAFRVKFAFNTVSTTTKNFVTDQSVLIPTPEDQVVDKGTFGYTQFALAIGKEMRRGHGRLQGYYGADLFFNYFSGNAANQNFKGEYGNEFSSDHTMPISSNFVGAANGFRTASVKQGAQLGIGLRGFVGVEYFIAPKISIGGELGWGVAYAIGFDGTQTDEEWDAVAGEVKSTTVKTNNGNQFIVGTDASTQGFFETNGWLGLGGNINLIFHF